MTDRFSDQRHTLADALRPSITRVQAELDAKAEIEVDAYDLLLEVAVKLGLGKHGRGHMLHTLDHYRTQLIGDHLSPAISMDELPPSV